MEKLRDVLLLRAQASYVCPYFLQLENGLFVVAACALTRLKREKMKVVKRVA